MPPSVERKLAAILSADVVGYSRLMAEDEDETVRRIGAYRREITGLVEEHRGRVVDFTGDNFLAEFPTATDAVEAAAEIQRVIKARNAGVPTGRAMQFRMGVHLGEVRVEGERIYGDGVNIAARLEGLAEPGGVCISGTVHDLVQNKLDAGFDDLGEQTVKNIPDPVHAYQVRERAIAAPHPPGLGGPRALRVGRAAVLAVAAVVAMGGLGIWATWTRVLGLGVIPSEQPALPDKPSIVVLPFSNMSEDAAQEFFADGITEDLTTDLSRSASLFVISRNSAFSYKGQSPKVEDVGRELGVRYVLEGSVRREADRVRITAQLIDATTGFHVWSERYDRTLEGVFAVQSEISEEILVAVGIEISEAERARLRQKPTQDFTAYESVSKGYEHFWRITRKDHQEARRWAQRALELDPEYADAFALLARTYSVEYNRAWNLDPALQERSRELAQRAIELDPSSLNSNIALAAVGLQQGKPEEAAGHARRAIEIAPNDFNGHVFLGRALIQQGQPLDGLGSIRRAFRLNPRASRLKATIHHLTGRSEEAVKIWERWRAANPDTVSARRQLIDYYVSVERLEEARAIVPEILAINPALTAEVLARHGIGRPPEDEVPALIASLRRAGLP